MARRSRYRWRNLRVDESGRSIRSDPERDKPKNTGEVVVRHVAPSVVWRARTARYEGQCRCGCGETIKRGERVLIKRGGGAMKMSCARRLGIRPGDE